MRAHSSTGRARFNSELAWAVEGEWPKKTPEWSPIYIGTVSHTSALEREAQFALFVGGLMGLTMGCVGLVTRMSPIVQTHFGMSCELI